uniref:ZP domain-containing protein n=1 Tax=Ditylenchus dipsaci TaxID=166011 RepID=A0A915DQC7_9BILA
MILTRTMGGMGRWMACTSILLALIRPFVGAIPVDNGVEGEPTIECGADAIEVTFKTRNAFNGRLYVKGRYGQGDCQNEQIGRSFTGITLSFNTCSVQRLRSLNPKGIFASTTVVISFHPIFVTKVDRVYHVQCFYMESEKTVNQQIQVSDITTAFITHQVPMPICRYEILEGGPSGTPLQFAVVVYHKWTCDTETQETFCMIVHTCFVDDATGSNGTSVQMINDQGCALDKYLLNNLEYPTDLIAGQEAHIFKYGFLH